MIEKTDQVCSIEFNAANVYGTGHSTVSTHLAEKIKQFGGMGLTHIDTAKFIDNSHNYVLFAPAHSYVHAAFLNHTHDLAAIPERLALLPIDLEVYFIEVRTATAADFAQLEKWTNATKILFIYTRCAASTKETIERLNQNNHIQIEEAKIKK